MVECEIKDLIRWVGPKKKAMGPGLPVFSHNCNPIIEKSVGYVSAFSSKRVIAFRVSDGKMIWRHRLPSFGGCPLVLGRSSIFVGNDRGVRCISKNTGRLIWKYEPYKSKNEDFYGEPIKFGSNILILDRAGFLHCLNQSSGRLKYRIEISNKSAGEFNAPMLLHIGKLYALSTSGQFHCVNPQTGEVMWSLRLKAGGIHKPLIWKNRIVLHSSKKLFLVEIKNQKVKVLNKKIIKDVIVKDGKLYALVSGKGSTVLYRLGAKLIQIERFAEEIHSFCPHAAEDTLALLGYGNLILYDALTKKIKTQINGLIGAMPLVAKNKIFAIDLAHEYLCLAIPKSLS